MTALVAPIGLADEARRRDAHDKGDRALRRRISLIWSLLLFNGLGFIGFTVLPLTKPIAQLLTMSALGLAFLLAVSVNRKLVLRPNLLLALASVLAATSFAASTRGSVGVGALLRCGRLSVFLAVLWLLTPWWGRRDMLLARCHLRGVVAVSLLVLVGVLVAPSTAFSGGAEGGRLVSVLWPIPAPQVAAYAALAAGIGATLWMAGAMGRTTALLLVAGGTSMVVLSHTRTALIALVVGVALAAVTLFTARRRVRRVVATALVLLAITGAFLVPAVSEWFTRDQSVEQLGNLTGRRTVWDALLDEPRPAFNQWFGFGLSDKSFDGLAIDSTWLAVYQDQGLFGVVVVAAMLLSVLIAAARRPPGAARAVATFVIVYCAVASYTEVTIGDASPYLLAVVAAASLVVPSKAERFPSGAPTP